MHLPRLTLVSALACLLGCPFENPTQDEFVRDWATVLCAQRDRCGCTVDTCEADAEARIRELWPEDPDWLPNKECWNARIEAIEALGCEETESNPFDWELRACRPWTSFLGLGEPCEPPPASGTFGTGCESGLVCDAAQKRCVNPSERPISGQACLISSDGYQPAGLCADGLTCMDGLCLAGTEDAVVPPPILCSGDVYVF